MGLQFFCYQLQQLLPHWRLCLAFFTMRNGAVRTRFVTLTTVDPAFLNGLVEHDPPQQSALASVADPRTIATAQIKFFINSP
jgi:hypothetical protein